MTIAWWPTSHTSKSLSIKQYNANAMVSSTTPRLAPRWSLRHRINDKLPIPVQYEFAWESVLNQRPLILKVVLKAALYS
jgi:hypothetical protein